MAAKKKTSFYHTRNKIVPNKELAAEVLGVSVAEIERMDIEGAPVMAERLLRLWDHKYVGVPGWDGWLFSRGVLRFKNQQWRADGLLQARVDDEKVLKLENEICVLFSCFGLLKITRHLLKNNSGFLFLFRLKKLLFFVVLSFLSFLSFFPH